MTKYRVNFYTLSDCHAEKIIEAADLPALMAQLDREMIDLSAPFTIYEIGDNKPMTAPLTPAPLTPAEQFREEIRNSFDLLHVENGEIRAEIETLRSALATIAHGLAHAATATTTTSGLTEIMPATRITKTRTAGKDYYKIMGGRYTKRGVTIWIEGLKALDLDPATIAWDSTDGYTFETPLNVTVLMKEYKDEESGEIKNTPHKVIGKA